MSNAGVGARLPERDNHGPFKIKAVPERTMAVF
jgi:hypothetical protein